MAFKRQRGSLFVMDICVGIAGVPLVKQCSQVQLQSSSSELTSKSCPSSSNMMESTGKVECGGEKKGRDEEEEERGQSKQSMSLFNSQIPTLTCDTGL